MKKETSFLQRIKDAFAYKTSERLTEVFQDPTTIIIEFDDTGKFILFSDIHRGDNSWADDFAHNQNLFFHALKYYNDNEFTYIEIGDGDELWENKLFEDIRKAHCPIFWRLRQFYEDGRLYLIWGNHNREWKRQRNVIQHLYEFYYERKRTTESLFKGIKVYEGIILKRKETDSKLFLVHGHQGDPLNDQYWWVGRFIVRNIWKFLQNFTGWKDPTSPAKNFKKRAKVEDEIVRWIEINNQIVIAGHTHRPRFPDNNEDPPYFNTGSCVHPRSITGIEIANGEIALIKWFIDVNSDEGGTLFINKETLVGPEKLTNFFQTNKLNT